MKRLVLLLMCAALLFSLTACGGDDRGPEDVKDGGRVWYLGWDVKESDFDDIPDELDPEEMYNSITYTEPMLYGNYWLYDHDEMIDDFIENAEYQTLEYAEPLLDDFELLSGEMSVLPCRIEAGPATLNYTLDLQRIDRSQNWAVLGFAFKNGGCSSVVCTFEVEGDKVRYSPLSEYLRDYDDDFNLLDVNYTVSDTVLEYTYSIRGPYLTLSAGNESVTLCAFSFSDNQDGTPSLSGCAAEGSAKIEGVEQFVSGSSVAAAHFAVENYSDGLEDVSLRIRENGLATLRWVEKTEDGTQTVHSRQFVYFDNNYGVVFADRENVYYYYESTNSYKQKQLLEGTTEEEAVVISSMTETVVEEVAQRKVNLIDELVKAFDEAGITVQVNRATGEMAIDSSILFGGDSAELGDEGKAFLDKFIEVYSGVVFSDTYRDFVARTLVEGHTAPLSGSTYESGLPLSQERAEAVKAYCLSADSAYADKLADTLEAVGMSNSRPIYDDDGNVDLDASRRVCFRFVVDLEKAIREE